MTFRILYVCTGNVCRSPAAELLTRAWTASADVEVESAGVQALVDDPVDPPTAAVLRGWGVDPSSHRARQFRPAMAARADLILVAELRHRDVVMTEVPQTLRRTFTVREFARLTATLDAAPARAVVAGAAAARGLTDPVEPAEDDIPDPFRVGSSQALQVARLIAAAVETSLTALGLLRRAPAPSSRPRPGPRPRPLPRRPVPRADGFPT